MDTFSILANDQFRSEITVFDLARVGDSGVLEEGKILSFPTRLVSGMQFRSRTVFGDVLLVCGQGVQILSYPSGRVIFDLASCGRNTHAVELLPGGNLVVANSTGCDFRLYNTSSLLHEGVGCEEYRSYPCLRPHGVLWDPVYERLWVLGAESLAAYRTVGEGTDQYLEPIEGSERSLAEFENGGHDLSPHCSDSRYLYCTPRSGALAFDKETGLFSRPYPLQAGISACHCKAFSQFSDGSFLYVSPSLRDNPAFQGWKNAAWCTDRVLRLWVNSDGSVTEREYRSLSGAFYKVRVLNGAYL